MDRLIEEKKWTDDQRYKLTGGIKIRYADGSVLENLINLNKGSDLFDMVNDLYTMKDIGNTGKYVSFLDWDEAVTFINTDEVSVIEMPLVGVEKRILDSFAEGLGEMGEE